jgi:hypothetical protein
VAGELPHPIPYQGSKRRLAGEILARPSFIGKYTNAWEMSRLARAAIDRFLR